MNTLLRIENLVVQRKRRTVLEISHLQVNRGERLAVIGPNGAGKSTLLLSIAGLIKPQSGQISFNHSGNKWRSPMRRNMALILQDPLLLDRSVFANVAIGLRFRKIPHVEINRRVQIWLEQLNISHLAKTRASQISGGEAQRVNLARALVLQPKLLLLDEPFSALDAPSQEKLLVELKALLVKTHTTTIFVTHNLQQAAQFGDRVAIILEGHLRQTGDLQEMQKYPADGAVAAFMN